MNIINAITEFALDNHYVDIEDKVPIFVCSIGAHLFNTANKCSRCDFDLWPIQTHTSQLTYARYATIVCRSILLCRTF